MKNNLLAKAVLDNIKDEVAQSLQMKSFSVPTIVKQELPVDPLKIDEHSASNHHYSHAPISMHSTSGQFGLLNQTTRVQQASPTTAASLQNQPHIIIRVNSTPSHGGQHIKQQQFLDEGTNI